MLSEVSESLANSSDLPDVMDGPHNNELIVLKQSILSQSVQLHQEIDDVKVFMQSTKNNLNDAKSKLLADNPMFNM